VGALFRFSPVAVVLSPADSSAPRTACTRLGRARGDRSARRRFACLGYQAWWILPYTPLFPVEVKMAKNRNNRARIRIIVANVLASNRNAEKLLEIVRTFDPDILVTLESNMWWQERLDVLEEELSFHHQVSERKPLRDACLLTL
jgi:endonuclease/exonuclease/phosphatase (EEP) superfamily protein YafD